MYNKYFIKILRSGIKKWMAKMNKSRNCFRLADTARIFDTNGCFHLR